MGWHFAIAWGRDIETLASLSSFLIPLRTHRFTPAAERKHLEPAYTFCFLKNHPITARYEPQPCF